MCHMLAQDPQKTLDGIMHVAFTPEASRDCGVIDLPGTPRILGNVAFYNAALTAKDAGGVRFHISHTSLEILGNFF